jgi:hypothetical protein
MLFRFLAALLALIALLAFVSDVTPALNGGRAFHPSSLAEHWTTLIPASFEGAKRAVTATPAGFLWDSVVAPFLNLSTFIVLSVMSLLFGYLGRRRRRIKIFAN